MIPLSTHYMDPVFEEKLKTYVFTHQPKVCILTPCYGTTCYVNYVMALMNTIDLLKQYDIRYKVDFCCNDSLVSRARNNLIARTMSDPTVTHMLFVDADITWNPQDIIKLLLADQYIIGGIYPLKKYHWSKVEPNQIQNWLEKQKTNEILQQFLPTHLIQHQMVDYNFNPVTTETMVIENNQAEVKHVACGFMMIKRETIELMQKAFPSTKYTDDVSFLSPSQNDYAFALFDCGVEDGQYLSEDWMFCSRWKKMGGKIYAEVTINLTHSGVEHFQGSFLSSLVTQTVGKPT